LKGFPTDSGLPPIDFRKNIGLIGGRPESAGKTNSSALFEQEVAEAAENAWTELALETVLVRKLRNKIENPRKNPSAYYFAALNNGVVPLPLTICGGNRWFGSRQADRMQNREILADSERTQIGETASESNLRAVLNLRGKKAPTDKPTIGNREILADSERTQIEERAGQNLIFERSFKKCWGWKDSPPIQGYHRLIREITA